MFSKKVLKEVMKSTLALDTGKRRSHKKPAAYEDRVISMLIHDIFGGEILKTHLRNEWHFYNRINGERIDLSGEPKRKSDNDIKFEDIPATPDETFDYFDKNDYSTLPLYPFNRGGH